MSYHPLIDPFAVVGLTACIIGFTPARSPLRIGCLPILLALTWHCVVQCPLQITRSAWASAVGGYTLSSVVHYLDVALLGGWSFDLHGPAKNWLVTPAQDVTPTLKPLPKNSSITARLQFGLATCFSWRFIHTPYQVKRLPQLDPSLQSRPRYLRHTAITIIACYLMLDVMDSSSDAEVAAKFYSPDKVGLFSRIGDVTLEELVMRFFAAIGLCIGLVSFQRGVYNIMALVCVGSGLSAPNDWPPFNGPVFQTYSLRDFWSIFWHQINTHRLTVLSHYLFYNVLKLQKGGSWERYPRTWLIFILSGIWHVAIDVSSGIPMNQSGAMWFFSIQPLGIVIEDLILSRYNIIPGPKTPRPPALIQRLLGFAWMCLWMTWTAPAYLYPIMDKGGSEGDDGVVPISIIALVKRALG